MVVLAGADLDSLFSGSLVASSAAVVVTGLLYVGNALLRRLRLGDSVIGAHCAVYVNVGNLGLLGDAALVTPPLLLQLLVLQPLARGPLDVQGSQASALQTLSRPITLGSAVGLPVALADRRPPDLIVDPLALIGASAVPSMLLAYGTGLRLGPLPGRGVAPTELSWILGLKVVSQAFAAYAVGRFVLDLGAPPANGRDGAGRPPDRSEHLRHRQPLRPLDVAGTRCDLLQHRLVGDGHRRHHWLLI